jgi:hypothetical protein
MKRERAKELLPIIRAYAEGKTIQHKVVDEWVDLSDPNFAGFDLKLYRVKPSEKYNEIFKLKSMLEENHIPFEWIEHNDFRNGYQICYPEKAEKCVCSIIEHSFSYGSQKDLLEIQGLLTAEEEECDTVLGNLTAENVFERIRKDFYNRKVANSTDEKDFNEKGFKKELTSLLNRYGWDSACETPDHILADYVERCMTNLCSTMGKTIAWHSSWKRLGEAE